MNIIVVGCGKIGTAIVKTLVAEGHDLTVLDSNSKNVTDLTNIYDVIGVCGNGADCETLEDAGVASADLLVATTASDEMNMLACFLAKKMGAKHTVARIRNPEYNDNSLSFMRQHLALSMSINPELLVAQELNNLLKLPSAFKVEYFSRRNLEMIELKLREDSPLCGKKLSKLREKQKIEFLIGAVLRGGQVIIPDGNFELAAGDIIALMAAPHEMQKLLKSMGIITKKARSIMILGGSTTAYYLAKMLTSLGNDVTVIEKKIERCHELGDILPQAIIINGDGTRQEVLVEEGLSSVDAFVALTGMDEENILISLFAKEKGVSKVITKVNRDELIGMSEKLGLDSTVSTKSITSDIVLRYVRALENSRGSNIETLYKIMDGHAEALEFNVLEGSKVVGVPIKDLKFKPGILIAGIIRSRKRANIPSGDSIINAGDRVIVLTAQQGLNDLDDIIR